MEEAIGHKEFVRYGLKGVLQFSLKVVFQMRECGFNSVFKMGALCLRLFYV